MPKRQSPSAHRFQGRGNTRPRGRGRGRGGHGGQFGGAGGRRNHNHQPEDGYISLSARSSRVQKSTSSYAGHKRSRNDYRQVEVKFNKAKKDIDIGSSGEDSDQGLDSDEICESEEEFLEQPFDWIEADQDPNRKKQLPAATPASTIQPELLITPSAGWGGALTYNPLGNGMMLQQQPLDTIVIGSVGDDRTLNTVGSAGQIIGQLGPSCITRTSTEMNTSSHSSLKLAANKHKRIKAIVDLTEDDQITTSTHSMMENMEITATDLRFPLVFKTIVSTEEVGVTKSTVKNTTTKKEFAGETPTSANNEKGSEEHELEPVLWILDTKPDVIPTEELSDTYIELPSYLGFSNQNQKKTRRSKRGGRQLKEKEREKRKATIANGTLLLEDDASDEVDDDQKALEDYLQNTMDHDNEDHLDATSFSLLQGLSSGPGHSMDIGGFDPDDSDFDQEDISDYGGDDDDYDDFTVPKASRQNRRNSNELAAAIDTALSLDPSAHSTANFSRPTHYQPYELNHMVMHLTVENITQMNRVIRDFVSNRADRSMKLPRMSPQFRNCVRALAVHYKIATEGVRKQLFLTKTHRTELPKHDLNMEELVKKNGRNLASTEAFKGKNVRTRGQDFARGRFRDRREPSNKDGTVVGDSASEISVENVGHRLLAKMGWSPGTGLGASREGITQPVTAVVKTSKLGIGYQ